MTVSNPSETTTVTDKSQLLGTYEGIAWFKPELPNPFPMLFGITLGSCALYIMAVTILRDLTHSTDFNMQALRIIVYGNIAVVLCFWLATLFLQRRHFYSAIWDFTVLQRVTSFSERQHAAMYWQCNTALRSSCEKPQTAMELFSLIEAAEALDRNLTQPLLPDELLKTYRQYWDTGYLDKALMPSPEEYKAFLQPPPASAREDN